MTSGGGRVMACICANEPKRFLSCGSCFHDTDDLPLRLATGVFNLVCALHAAADGSEVESDRELHGCLVTIWERLFILSGRHCPPGNTREKKSGRQSVAENPFAHAEDRMACNDHFTVLKTVSATLLACRRCPLRPRPVSAVSRRRGMEKRRQGRIGWGRTYIL